MAKHKVDFAWNVLYKCSLIHIFRCHQCGKHKLQQDDVAEMLTGRKFNASCDAGANKSQWIIGGISNPLDSSNYLQIHVYFLWGAPLTLHLKYVYTSFFQNSLTILLNRISFLPLPSGKVQLYAIRLQQGAEKPEGFLQYRSSPPPAASAERLIS